MNSLNKIREILLIHQKKRALVLLVFLFAGMLLEMFGIGVLLPVLSAILSPEILKKIPIVQSVFDFFDLKAQEDIIKFSLIFLMGVYFIKSFYLVVLNYFQNKFTTNLASSLSNRLFAKYLYYPYSYHLQKNSSELIKILQIDINHFMVYLQARMALVTEIAMVFSVVVVLFFVEPFGVLFVMVFFFIAGTAFFQIIKRKSLAWGKTRTENERKRSKAITEGLNGVKEVILLGRQTYFKKQLENLNQTREEIYTKQITIGQIPRYYLELLSVFVLISFILVMYSQGKDINELFTILGVFLAATIRVLPSINRILGSLQQIKFYSSSIDLFLEGLREKSIEQEERAISPSEEKEIKLKSKIEIKDLGFSYLNSEKVILSGVSFDIPIGSTIGIIGESGSGKSTLINIISGLLLPKEGGIFVDGQRIEMIYKRSWQNQIGYVSQQIYLCDDTILSNIAFGLNEEEISLKRVIEVAKEAQIHDYIMTLPKQYATFVGERGVQLSGGQQQRIGIARALYHNPKVLVLDEATSALDTKTEEGIMEAIGMLKGKKTILIVTHRLVTLKDCDKIIEIEKGRIK